jgi:cobalt/nickel transport system permease protein
MITEPFAAGTSWIHRIDPRYKIIFATLYSMIVAISSKFPTLITALFFSLVLVGIGQLNLIRLIKRLFVVFWFLLILWILLPLTFTGEPFYIMGPLTITRPGIILSAQITIKSIAILTALTSFIATIEIPSLGHALNRLLLPDKIVYLLLITYRYIFVIEQEYMRLLRAAKMRGFGAAGTSLHSYKTYAYFIGMLFVRSSERARRVYQAMMCRGFNGKFHSLAEFKTGSHDFIFLIIMVLIITSLIFLEFTTYDLPGRITYLVDSVRF